MVLLNYRGSTGFGEASIQSLPGRIGTADVADCLASLQAAVDAGGAGGAAERDAIGGEGSWRGTSGASIGKAAFDGIQSGSALSSALTRKPPSPSGQGWPTLSAWPSSAAPTAAS